MLTTSGPSRAKPSANAAFSVRMKMPFAEVSSLRGTTSGIIAASAGEKNTLTIEIAVFSRMISQKLSPTAHSAMNRMPRIRLVPMRINRRSMRST